MQGDLFNLVFLCFSFMVVSTLQQPGAVRRFVSICRMSSHVHYDNLTEKSSLLGPLRLRGFLQILCINTCQISNYQAHVEPLSGVNDS